MRLKFWYAVITLHPTPPVAGRRLKMASYTINYACGHGSFDEQLFGKHIERDSRIEWLSANKVCPACYKAKMVAQDAATNKTANIKLVPAAEPVLVIEVSGQIEANKEALYALGAHWADASNGLMGYFSMAKARRVLAIAHKVTSAEDAGAWISSTQAALAGLGYQITDSLSALDMAWLAKLVGDRQTTASAKDAAKAKLAEIQATDPSPPASPLRNRIAGLEKSSGQKWSGKICGKKGYWNFYVADKKYSATDAEVAEREINVAQYAAWQKKYATEIEAAK